MPLDSVHFTPKNGVVVTILQETVKTKPLEFRTLPAPPLPENPPDPPPHPIVAQFLPPTPTLQLLVSEPPSEPPDIKSPPATIFCSPPPLLQPSDPKLPPEIWLPSPAVPPPLPKPPDLNPIVESHAVLSYHSLCFFDEHVVVYDPGGKLIVAIFVVCRRSQIRVLAFSPFHQQPLFSFLEKATCPTMLVILAASVVIHPPTPTSVYCVFLFPCAY
ncbi:hypothetical protein TSUD_120250 [Trifolium subterraneum]|uniref:Uncharacterized protein n=1 Tax=Trifolium subterraneum TaxID=3900 RepID=A0A2Z6MD94_TRISU|nr:hypothetical protein TSUD_120250 [Trifolium subterraneum]